MISSTMTPQAITIELGNRLRVARLNADLTQKQLAVRAGVSIKAVVNSEKGKANIESFVAILLALNLVEQLNLFLPKPVISPLQLAKAQGNARKRASGKSAAQSKETPSW